MTKSIHDPLDWFPYEPRPHQQDAVIFSSDIFNEQTVGILSADCGVGKTIAALSGYVSAREKEPDSRLFILTRTHSQTTVFEDEIAVLRSRGASFLTSTSMISRSHVCPMKTEIDNQTFTGFLRGCAMMIRTGRCRYYWSFYRRHSEISRPVIRDRARQLVHATIENGVVNREIAEEIAVSESICPYELLRWTSRKSRIIIGPYSYLFRTRIRNAILNSLGLDLFDIDLLVDEAHNLSEHVLDIESSSLTGEDLRWLRENKESICRESGMPWLGECVDFFWNSLLEKTSLFSTEERQIELDTWDAVPRFINGEQISAIIEQTQAIANDEEIHTETPFDRLIDFLYTGKRAVDGNDWHILARVRHLWKLEHLGIDDVEIVIRPLNAAGLIAPVLRGVRSALVMSGTIRPTDLYASIMGIRGAKTQELASPYPRGSRLLLLESSLTTRYAERGPSLYRKLAERIGTALTAMPADKSALVAFPSYQMMQEILSYNIECGYRHRIVETKAARLENLKVEIEAMPCAVFLVYGGKFSEGIDLVKNGDSLVNLIIGVGIPFTPPNPYQQALQEWYEERFGPGKGFYYSSIVPSIRKVVQLVGRLRRSPNDWGVVLLLDRRFQRYMNMFGADVAADIWPYAASEEIHDAITLFISDGRDIM